MSLILPETLTVTSRRSPRTSSARKPSKATAAAETATSTDRPRVEHRLDIGGQHVRVAVWPGSAETERPPLLLFNGIGVALEFLEPFVDAMADVEIITFDVPGTGASPAPRLPYRLWTMARLAATVLDRLGYQRVDVLGASWGGALAQEFARQFPQRCRRLVLVATLQGMPMVPAQPQVMWKFLTQRSVRDPATRLRLAGEIYGGSARHHPEVMSRLAKFQVGANHQGFLLQQMALVGWSSVPWLHFVRHKSLVMAGRDDPLVPCINAQWISQLMPRARLHVYEDGHLFLVTNPQAAAGIIDDFLQKS